MSVATPTCGRTPTSWTTAFGPSLAISGAAEKQIIEHKQHVRNATRTKRWPTLRYSHEPACCAAVHRAGEGGGPPWPPCHGPAAHGAAYGQAVTVVRPTSWITYADLTAPITT